MWVVCGGVLFVFACVVLLCMILVLYMLVPVCCAVLVQVMNSGPSYLWFDLGYFGSSYVFVFCFVVLLWRPSATLYHVCDEILDVGVSLVEPIIVYLRSLISGIVVFCGGLFC